MKSEIFIDIETIPAQPADTAQAEIAKTISHPAQMKKEDTIQDWHNGEGKYAGVKDAAIEEEYLKTSFDGAKGQICSIAWAFGDGDIFSCTSNGTADTTEINILCNFLYSVNGYLLSEKLKVPFFIGHYLGGFDLKFLYQRAVINRIQPDFDLKFSGRHGVDFFDNQIAWAGYKDRISQDNLCKALGIPGKPDGMDGSKVYGMWLDGKYSDINEYNIDDVDKCRQIYKRLKFL